MPTARTRTDIRGRDLGHIRAGGGRRGQEGQGQGASFADDAGADEGPLESAAHPPSGTVLSTNRSATGAPSISGAAVVGRALTAGSGTIADLDGLPAAFPADYTFQWVREDADGTNAADIPGATSATYVLAAADAGKKIRVRASFTDGAGYGEGPLASAVHPSSGTVLPNNPATGRPAVTGTARVGRTLTATPGTIADLDGLPSAFPDGYTLQWTREDADGSNRTDIAGATSATYVLRSADRGRRIRVRASFTDDDGYMRGAARERRPSRERDGRRSRRRSGHRAGVELSDSGEL